MRRRGGEKKDNCPFQLAFPTVSTITDQYKCIVGQILRKHSGGLRGEAGGMGRSHTTLRRQGAGKQIEQHSSYKIHKKGPSKLTFLLLEKEVRTKEKKKTALFSIFLKSLF